MTHPYGLGQPAPADDLSGPDILPVDEPTGEPLEDALAEERDTEPRFHAPVEIAQGSREESVRREADATG